MVMVGGCGADREMGSLGSLASLKHLQKTHTCMAPSTGLWFSGEPILVSSHSLDLIRTSKHL